MGKGASFLCLLVLVFGLSCKGSDSETHRRLSPAPSAAISFEQAFGVISHSCFPCHNVQTLPEVIRRTRRLKVEALGGEERLRLLVELENLYLLLKEGAPLNFVGKPEIHAQFESMPGELYTMLENGVMSPPWAPELMKAIGWPEVLYQPLTPEKRITLMLYVKPFSEKYLR